MLTKLLKYDLKYMLKNMIVFYVLAIFFSITTRLLFEINGSTIIDIISQISVGTMFSMIASILINTLMRSWVRFRDSIYKDEAYLTHTLPVSKDDIYNSKFIQTLLFFLISFLVVMISIFIAYYTKDRWILLKDAVFNITRSLNFNTTLFVIGIISVLFLEIFNMLQCGYFGLLLGHRKNNNKIGFSVLYGFIVYLISQSVVLLSIFIIGVFNSEVMELFKSSNGISSETFKLLAIVVIMLYVFVIALMNFVNRKIFNKGVNIE